MLWFLAPLFAFVAVRSVNHAVLRTHPTGSTLAWSKVDAKERFKDGVARDAEIDSARKRMPFVYVLIASFHRASCPDSSEILVHAILEGSNELVG